MISLDISSRPRLIYPCILNKGIGIHMMKTGGSKHFVNNNKIEKKSLCVNNLNNIILVQILLEATSLILIQAAYVTFVKI